MAWKMDKQQRIGCTVVIMVVFLIWVIGMTFKGCGGSQGTFFGDYLVGYLNSENPKLADAAVARLVEKQDVKKLVYAYAYGTPLQKVRALKGLREIGEPAKIWCQAIIDNQDSWPLPYVVAVKEIANELVKPPVVPVAPTPTAPPVPVTSPPVIPTTPVVPAPATVVVPPGPTPILPSASLPIPAIPSPPLPISATDIIKGLGDKNTEEARKYALWLIRQENVAEALGQAHALSEKFGNRELTDRIDWCFKNLRKTEAELYPREVRAKARKQEVLEKEYQDVLRRIAAIEELWENGSRHFSYGTNRRFYSAYVYPFYGYGYGYRYSYGYGNGYGYGSFSYPIAYGGPSYPTVSYYPLSNIKVAWLRKEYLKLQERKGELEKLINL